jgi:hypothetical protein
MRDFSLLFVCIQIAALSSACAGIGVCPPGQRLVDGQCTPPLAPCPDEITKPIDVGCVVSPEIPGDTGNPTLQAWDLIVKPGPIISGQRFGASFEGTARFRTSTLNTAQCLLGAFRRVALVDLEARVQVRNGAEVEDGDVVLEASPFPKTCTYDENGNRGPDAGPEFPRCSEENDNEDGSNDDCTGLDGVPSPDNRCLSFVEIPTSDDCNPGGECAELGHLGPGSSCECSGFCATEVVELGLEAKSGVYIADGAGSVLFGWADRGIDVLTGGPNRGAYDPDAISRPFEQDIVLSGMNAVVETGSSGGFPFAFECIMGVGSRGDDGVQTIDPWVSPSPDGVLISCPIQEPE